MKQSLNKCKQTFFNFTFILLNLMILTIVMTGCEEKKPLKLGFVGGLTGRLSDLGISGRNGVTLAVEQANQAGGINGHLVKLIVKNDQQDPDVALKVDKELIQEGVVAIIGHMTSSMSMAVLPLINKAKIVMLSPTASTNKLTGIDDYFFEGSGAGYIRNAIYCSLCF